jgi:hypothetical protein
LRPALGSAINIRGLRKATKARRASGSSTIGKFASKAGANRLLPGCIVSGRAAENLAACIH